MRNILRLALLGALLSVSFQVHADLFGDVVKIVTAPVRVPIETTVDVLQGRDPARSAREAAQASGRTLNSGINVAERVNQQINDVPREAIRNNFGSDWERAYNALTSSQRIQTEMGFTSGRFLGGCLQQNQCSLNQLLAMPIAASLRDAYKLYSPYSSPIDFRAQSVLSRVVNPAIVSNTRIAVGNTPDFTVPGFLNSGHEFAGSGHAVTIGNLIIFSRPLDPQSLSDWNWLLHELKHVEQYSGYSWHALEAIDGFAGDYLMHYNSMENDAQNSADARQSQLNQICRFGC